MEVPECKLQLLQRLPEGNYRKSEGERGSELLLKPNKQIKISVVKKRYLKDLEPNLNLNDLKYGMFGDTLYQHCTLVALIM